VTSLCIRLRSSESANISLTINNATDVMKVKDKTPKQLHSKRLDTINRCKSYSMFPKFYGVDEPIVPAPINYAIHIVTSQNL